MRVLKGISIGILSFLLFLSLTGLGLALTLRLSVLSPDFAVSAVNKVDIASLAKEYIPTDTQMPPELRNNLVSLITKREPQIKQQIDRAIYPTYDYLLGKQPSLDLGLILRNSLLQPEFLSSLVDDLNLAPLISQMISSQVNIPPGFERYSQYLDQAIVQAEPQLKQDFKAAIPSFVDYLLGRTQSFSATISIKPFLDNLKPLIKQDFLTSPPAQFAGLSPAQLSQVFDQFYATVVQMAPSNIQVNESTLTTFLGTGFQADFLDYLNTGSQQLAQGREYVAKFQLAFNLLILFTILFILGIVLIYRNVKASAKSLGVTFITYGALEFAGTFIMKYFADQQIVQLTTLPANMSSVISQLLNDAIYPLQVFSLSFLIVGIVLIVLSHIYKPHKPAYQA